MREVKVHIKDKNLEAMQQAIDKIEERDQERKERAEKESEKADRV